jgi:hypothetical protein
MKTAWALLIAFWLMACTYFGAMGYMTHSLRRLSAVSRPTHQVYQPGWMFDECGCKIQRLVIQDEAEQARQKDFIFHSDCYIVPSVK